MTPEAWTFFSVLTASTIGVFSEVIKTRKKIEKKIASVHEDVAVAASAADEAAHGIKPISNGFAASVLQSLNSLKEGQRELHHEIQDVKRDVSIHLHDHVRQGMKNE